MIMRVLVVDDQEDLLELLRVSLSMSGFDVAVAASGKAALETLASGATFDVVVLDVQMPDVDGWDILGAIRGDPRAADLPVIMCTVKASHEDAERAWRMGCDGYVTKPFHVAAFVEDVGAVAAASADARRATRERALIELERAAVDGHITGAW
jgi:DNA-binding response OmpR family regulator